MRVFKSSWFWRNYKKVKWIAGLSFLVLILYMLTNFLIIGVQKWIIDDVFIHGEFQRLPWLLTIFAIGFVSFGILNPVNAVVREAVYNKLLLTLSNDYMNHVNRLPMQEFQKERIATYAYNFSEDLRGFSETVAREIPTAIQQAIYILLLMGVIGFVSPVILIAFVSFVLVYILLGRYFGPKMKELNKDVQKGRNQLLVHIEEGISATREVIAFHRLKWERQIYDKLFGRYFSSVMKEGRVENKHLFLSEPLKWGGNISILGVGGYLVITGSLSIGWLVVIYQFGKELMDAMQLLFRLTLKISGKMSYFDRLDLVFGKETMDEGEEMLSEPVNEITFSNVSFQYDTTNHQVLNSIDLSVHRGQKVAFVGTSGGGKSTLLKLLSKDNEPNEGKIFVNADNKLRDLQAQSWSKKAHIVYQEPYLFQETLETNIRLGDEDISVDEIVDACQAAHIHDFIMTLPDGYQTVIGERGITLSGGQRQRIALARAIVHQPDVLLLDEATSALDLETERKVQQALDERMKGGIMMVVAHRLSTIENADVIYVLDDGKIVEHGSHDELMRARGVYTKLYEQNVNRVG